MRSLSFASVDEKLFIVPALVITSCQRPALTQLLPRDLASACTVRKTSPIKFFSVLRSLPLPKTNKAAAAQGAPTSCFPQGNHSGKIKTRFGGNLRFPQRRPSVQRCCHFEGLTIRAWHCLETSQCWGLSEEEGAVTSGSHFGGLPGRL